MPTVTLHSAPPVAENPNLFFRPDTLLGICQAVGEDFGFNPNWLRIAFGAVLVFAPVAVIGSYLGLGLVVAASRWIAPARPVRIPAPASAAPAIGRDIGGDSGGGEQRLAA